MAWTAPMTFASNTVLTSAQLNTHLRDNLIELAPAKASQAGGFFTTEFPNRIEQRIPKSHALDVTEFSKRSDWGDLGTPGPRVTVNTGTSAMVFLAAEMSAITEDATVAMGYEISGATFREPSDSSSVMIEGLNPNQWTRWCNMVIETELNPGLNTFTCKYKASDEDNDSGWDDRAITVIPF